MANIFNTLIIYDSLHGNTKKIADSISKGFDNIKVISVENITLEDIKGINLLIVGSPTHGGTAKPSLLEFLKSIPLNYLKDVYITSFDTRFDEKKLKLLLKLLVKTIGYAAIKISKILESKGGKLLIQPEGFFVEDTKGPITKGEEEKAVKWGEEIKSKYLDLGNE